MDASRNTGPYSVKRATRARVYDCLALALVVGTSTAAWLNDQPARAAGGSPTVAPSALSPAPKGNLGGPKATVGAGDEILAIDPKFVTELMVLGSEWRFIAHRWRREQPFTLIFSARAKDGVHTCTAGPQFDRILGVLTTIRVRRVVPEPEATELRGSIQGPLVRFSVAGDSNVDPAQYELFLPPQPNAPIVAFDRDLPGPVELNWDRRLFGQIERGCASLGVSHSVRSGP
jgi:hypothetical protein